MKHHLLVSPFRLWLFLGLVALTLGWRPPCASAASGFDGRLDASFRPDPNFSIPLYQHRRAVMALPEKQRAVVVLHYFEGHSCEEISKIVGCSLGTVWSRLHYACKRLKGVLEASEGLV